MSDWQNDRSRPILGRLGRMDGKSSSRSSKRAFYTQGTKKSYRTGGFQSKSFRKRRIWLTKKTIGEIDDVLLLFAINYRITAGNKVDLLDEGEASYHSFVYLTWRGLYYVRPKRKRRIIPYRLVCSLGCCRSCNKRHPCRRNSVIRDMIQLISSCVHRTHWICSTSIYSVAAYTYFNSHLIFSFIL